MNKLMPSVLSALLFCSVVISKEAHAKDIPNHKLRIDAQDCHEGTTGIISRFWVGNTESGDDMHFAISIKTANASIGPLIFWHHLAENEGKGIFSEAMTAYTSQSKVLVRTCWENRILALDLIQE